MRKAWYKLFRAVREPNFGWRVWAGTFGRVRAAGEIGSGSNLERSNRQDREDNNAGDHSHTPSGTIEIKSWFDPVIAWVAMGLNKEMPRLGKNSISKKGDGNEKAASCFLAIGSSH